MKMVKVPTGFIQDNKKKDTAKKKPDTAVTTKTTIQDNKKIRNPKSIYVKKNTNKVFKGKDGPDKAVVGNEKSNFKGDDGYST